MHHENKIECFSVLIAWKAIFSLPSLVNRAETAAEREVQTEEKYIGTSVGCKIQRENASPVRGIHYTFISNTDARISTVMQRKRLEPERV
jgi:hypothetical protein